MPRNIQPRTFDCFSEALAWAWNELLGNFRGTCCVYRLPMFAGVRLVETWEEIDIHDPVTLHVVEFQSEGGRDMEPNVSIRLVVSRGKTEE